MTKTYVPLHMSMLLGLFLWTSCGTEPGDVTEKTNDQMQENSKEMNEAKTEDHAAWADERNEAKEELTDLRTKFEVMRVREEERLKDGIKDAEKQAECKARIGELNTNIARIDASLMKLEASTGTDWNSVKSEAREVADDSKSWWERQKENVDVKTDSDHDKDGH